MFGEALDVDVAHVEADGPEATALELRLDGQGDLVPRGELVDEALAVAQSVAPSPRTASVIRKPSRSPSPASAVRNSTNSRSARVGHRGRANGRRR